MRGSSGRWVALALLTATVAVAAAWLDAQFEWITVAFDLVSRQFFEVSPIARVRRPSQLVLVRWHLAAGSVLVVAGLLAASRLNRHGRLWITIFGVGYLIRALIWILGSNLPLVPGDSCHYIEVATSVLRGEGPVKHYVESFFRDYWRIRENQGVLDDWATPLDAYVRAGFFRLAGLGPASPLAERLAVAKACSFILNLLALPVLYVFARRRYDSRVALGAMAVLAVLPVHAIYAGFILRESLVTLLSILAVWTLSETWQTERIGWKSLAWALLAGLLGGLAVLARTTALALLAGSGLFALVVHGRKRPAELFLWAGIAALVCLPWAWVTLHEYESPFFSYTQYFEYNFSWMIHHYDKGNTLPSQFYTWENLPEIVRVKFKSLFLIPVYSTMILGLPVVAGYFRALRMRESPGRQTDLLVAGIFLVFVLATLKSVADVNQVAELGRYYVPVFVLMLPTAVSGLLGWLDSIKDASRVAPWLAVAYCAIVWATPSWAHDASWLVKPYQVHWPALEAAGEWIEANPDKVPRQARIMTWLPWELRVISDRTTVLLPRSFRLRRIQEVILQYRVTHFLWGSFEPPPFYEVNPELWANELHELRAALELTDERELYRTTGGLPFPVRLYRIH
jgi:Dolichyl-phosphate-mannose-protein mannosyltransferase